jgi:hypothetical protein
MTCTSFLLGWLRHCDPPTLYSAETVLQQPTPFLMWLEFSLPWGLLLRLYTCPGLPQLITLCPHKHHPWPPAFSTMNLLLDAHQCASTLQSTRDPLCLRSLMNCWQVIQPTLSAFDLGNVTSFLSLFLLRNYSFRCYCFECALSSFFRIIFKHSSLFPSVAVCIYFLLIFILCVPCCFSPV